MLTPINPAALESAGIDMGKWSVDPVHGAGGEIFGIPTFTAQDIILLAASSHLLFGHRSSVALRVRPVIRQPGLTMLRRRPPGNSRGGPNERLQTGVDQRTTGTTTGRRREAAWRGARATTGRRAGGAVSASGLAVDLLSDDVGMASVASSLLNHPDDDPSKVVTFAVADHGCLRVADGSDNLVAGLTGCAVLGAEFAHWDRGINRHRPQSSAGLAASDDLLEPHRLDEGEMLHQPGQVRS